jgi:hypothetical protein
MLHCTAGPDCTLENLRLDTLQRDIVSKCSGAPAFWACIEEQVIAISTPYICTIEYSYPDG